MISLNKARKNTIYKIIGFNGEVDNITRRLMELGFIVGQKVKITSTSLLKKVFLVEIRGYVLSVRAALLCRVLVQGG